ncbi:hypothetical protein AYI70_g2657 [Smittium culicis]|uniref:Uncharacterized protein n=1 Tax=Smittium culicis TaxID=133412 RepID=A0A1R1Y736_9FUNG|nr:hypothetical protein AYI70_g2657 [Smittium culicis]
MIQTDGQPMGSEHSVKGIQNPLHEPKITDVESPTVHDPEEDWRPPTCSRPPEAESSCGRAELQDGDADVDMQNDPSEGLSDVTKPPGRFHAHPVLQAVPKPTVHDPEEDWRPPTCSRPPEAESSCGRAELQDGDADVDMQNDPEFVDHAISVDHPFGSGNQLQGNVPKGFIQQDPGSATRDQQTTERWPDDPEEFGELHWESSINVSRSTFWKVDATPTTRAQKPSSVNIEFMDIDSNFDETSNPEPVLLKESANIMEKSLVLARDAGNGDFYRSQRLSLGNSSGPPLLLWNMEPQGSKTSYQDEGTVDSAVCTESQDFSRKISVGLLRKQNHTLLCQEIRGHNLTRITGINREDLVPLPQDQHSPTGDILDAELALSATRRRPICIFPEQETRPLLHTGSPEGPLRESHNDTSDSNVEIRNLVPRPDGAFDFTATASPSNNSGPRSEKRKVAALGKQALDLDGLEDQWRFLETQGLGTYAIVFIVSKKRRVCRRSRYSSIQQRFLDWGISNKIYTPISAPQVINYLEEIYTVDKLKVGSIKAYKLAILQLSDNPAELAAHPMFSEFIKSLDENSIKSFIMPVMDISPVIKLLREWGQNSTLTVKQITAKLCWLLSVTGYDRASDIRRIDDQRSHIDKGVLNLVIVASKENEVAARLKNHARSTPTPILYYAQLMHIWYTRKS